MKTVKTILSIALAASVLMSCSKENQTQNPDDLQVNSLSEIAVSTDFNWSSSFSGNVEITVDAPNYLKTQGQPVELVDDRGKVLDKQFVNNTLVSFYVRTPQQNSAVYAYYPNTGEKVQITSNRVTLKLTPISLDGLSSNLIKQGKKSGQIKGKTQGTNMVLAGDFESTTNLPIDSSAYTNLRTSGSWYTRDSYGQILSKNGSNVFTSVNTARSADILQSFAVDGSEIFDFHYDYGGNGGFYILFYDDTKNFIGYTTVYTDGSSGFANFLTSEKVKFIQIYGFSSSNSWLDNVSLTEVVEPDDDQDGVINRKDDYPNDPARAYASYFPTLGRQTVAFEDLWPSNGDYDFNDLVISNKVEFRKDANGNLVDAVVKVKVLGLGAGLASGVGIHLLKSDKSTFSNDIIASVTGTHAHSPTNGQNVIVAFDNAKKVLKPFYNNNGVGPGGTPQEFTFIVTFNSNYNGEYILPDFFLFRSNDVGKEVHLPNYPATNLANTGYFNTKGDVNGTYKNAQGLPWAIEIVHPNAAYFHHPKEKIDICEAYPKFATWAKSNGRRYVGWMLLGDTSKLFVIQ